MHQYCNSLHSMDVLTDLLESGSLDELRHPSKAIAMQELMRNLKVRQFKINDLIGLQIFFSLEVGRNTNNTIFITSCLDQ